MWQKSNYSLHRLLTAVRSFDLLFLFARWQRWKFTIRTIQDLTVDWKGERMSHLSKLLIWPHFVPISAVFSTVALMLHSYSVASVRLSSVTLCILAKRCVLEKSYFWQSIGSRIWEIDWYQNEWPWPLFRGRIKVMSIIALGLHSTWNISETVRDKGLVPKDQQYEMA